MLWSGMIGGLVVAGLVMFIAWRLLRKLDD